MLEALFKQMPQLRGKIDYSEVSTITFGRAETLRRSA